MRTMLAFSLLCVFALPALAIQGPQVPPCSGCPQFEEPPYPQSGLWYDPERPGTGFAIQVQDGILGISYYGYDSDGKALWTLASGPLRRFGTGGVYWTFEGTLLRFRDGEVLNGVYRAPRSEPAGQLRVDFLQRNLLRFSVDDGLERNMVPFVFGTGTLNPFPQDSDYGLPTYGASPDPSDDRRQPWLIVETDPAQLQANGIAGRAGYGRAAELIHWAEVTVPALTGVGSYTMDFAVYERFVVTPDRVSIKCGLPALLRGIFPDESQRLSGLPPRPLCVVRAQGTPPNYYYMPLANLGDRHFKAVSAGGLVIEGFRLDYD